MKRHLGAGVYLAIASMTAAVPAWAGGSPRAHDGGFFLRLSAGPSSDKTEFDDSDGKNEISGTGVDINLAAGAVVAENLALHATAFGWVVSNPTVSLNGAELGDLSADLDLTAIGAGATYYLMPANVYVSGSVGSGSLTLDTGHASSETDNGVVLDLTLGKEWWVGNSWGLGAAGALSWHSVGLGGGGGEKASGLGFALRFSATMN